VGLAGDYLAADGWIRLHTNAPHHRLAALLVLGVADRSAPRRGAAIVGQVVPSETDLAAAREQERVDVASAVAEWNAADLETEIVTAGGAAAVLRSPADWAAHPQGQALAAEPLIRWTMAERVEPPLRVEPVETPWGEANLLASPLTIDGTPLRWSKPPRPLGTDKPRF
jgi:hypothetical protein